MGIVLTLSAVRKLKEDEEIREPERPEGNRTGIKK